jgi:coatomer subunit beta
VCRTNPAEKGKYIKVIISLLSTNNTAVVYECASSLVAMSSAPTAIRAAANCYTQLLATHSDNNVKLIVLDRLAELKVAHREVMQDVVMDVLRALGSPNADIRRKTLDIALELLTPRNIDEVVVLLKKEILKTQSRDGDQGDYRQMLVQAVHSCAVKFPDVAGSVVHLLMDFLGDSNTASALDVVFFVREIAETNPALREAILARLLDCFYQIRSSRVAACALWILGEYCASPAELDAAFSTLKASLGATPFFSPVEEAPEGAASDGDGAAKAAPPAAAPSKRPAVLSDGTYATQTAAAESHLATAPSASGGGTVPSLRALILSRDFFLAAAAGSALTKLALRQAALSPAGGVAPAAAHVAVAEAMLYVTCMLRLGAAPGAGHAIDAENSDRLRLCLRVLDAPHAAVAAVFLGECRASFARMTREKLGRDAEEAAARSGAPVSQPDDLIDFYHLKARKGLSQVELEDEVTTDLARATGFGAEGEASARKLSRMLQLTGFSDPVFAEAHVTVHQYDIVMDVTVLNRTSETLQNVCLELATMGDLKLVERPQNYTLAPGASRTIRANIKVSSTETGVIFGNIVFEGSTPGADRSVVVLNDIHIDIMDYISPASCADVAFRNMWAEFEWENKVAVNTSITDVQAFLDHIVASTNMRCLTPRSALEGDCGFLAANLYAKSVFGEDALVNVSVEKQPGDGKLGGYIRIRSKTQGIALSLGDKITLRQRDASAGA